MAVPSSHLTYSSYNVNHASLELLAGVTYHFKNSNGLHHFGLVKAYNQTEVDALNARVNELRGELMLAGAALEDVVAKNKQLENDLTECRNRKPEVISVVKVDNQLSTVRYVNFSIGKSTISADQMPNVAAVASYLKNHPKSKVVIKGYASKDGPEEVNIRLANQRAESVKNTD